MTFVRGAVEDFDMRMILTAAILAALSFPAMALDIPKDGYVVSDDPDELPEAVREKREALIAAAKSGDIEALRPIFAAQKAPPNVSFGDPADAVDHLKTTAGDGNGLETLAILRDVLEAPYAAMDGGDGTVYYVWPYLAAMPDLTQLEPAQVVDAYRIMGQQQFDEMREAGWLYWRAFIAEDGELTAFVAGD
jgi:hypothetical protein